MRSTADLRAYCLALPDAVETFPFGDQAAVFKVAGKVFALVPVAADPPQFSVKCDPEEALALREQYAAVTPGWHLNKRHWNTVVVDGTVPQDELEGFLADSWRLVVSALPKAVRLPLLSRLPDQ